MLIVKQRYPLYYYGGDYNELVPALSDTYFQEKNGQIFAQFYKGQLISKEVFDSIWGNDNSKEKEVQEVQETSTQEPLLTEEIQESFAEKVEVEEEEVQEVEKDFDLKEEVSELEKPTKKVPELKGKSKIKK